MTFAETRLPAGSTASVREQTEAGNWESSQSAIAWGPVIGGAFAALSTTAVLVALGSALGFSVASPWSGQGASLATIGVGAAIWLVVVQWISSGFGGYLAGRLRTKWAVPGSDEVFFRDTAHGFLAWSIATVIVGLLFASALGGGATVAATAAASAASAAADGAMDRGLTAGYVDTLFRPANPAGSPLATTTPAVGAPTAPAPDVRGEAGRIVNQAATSDLAPADRTYLAGIVAARTGLSQADAEARVDQVTTKAKQDADTARKAASSLAFLTALSLLIGAFVAAAGGALGGYHRDEI